MLIDFSTTCIKLGPNLSHDDLDLSSIIRLSRSLWMGIIKEAVHGKFFRLYWVKVEVIKKLQLSSCFEKNQTLQGDFHTTLLY